MNNIPDKSVDMILCDLPYGVTAKCKWDVIIPLNDYIPVEIRAKRTFLNIDKFISWCYMQEKMNYKEAISYFNENKKNGLWTQYNRIIKDNGAICLFGSEPFSTYLRLSNLKMYKYDWYFIKEKGKGHLNAKKQPLRSVENICIFYKNQPIYNPQFKQGSPYKKINCSKNNLNKGVYGTTNDSFNTVNSSGKRYPTTDLYFTSVQRTLHPSQKPVPLCEYMIKTYTNEGDIVLDNCMGSGSTGVAALKLHRKFIGIELYENFFEISKDRIIVMK